MVLEFKVRKQTLPIKEKNNKSYCSHLNVEVDVEERDLRCKNCNSRIDAFDYIVKWAHKEVDALYNLKRLETEIKQKQDIVIELDRQIRNLKAKKTDL